jgi:replication factor C small subunit
MNWTEKYRPKRLNDIIGQQKFVDDALSWVERNDMPNICLYGPAGTGKTSAGLVLAREFLGNNFNNNFKEINASQDRRLDTIRTTITNFASWKSTNDVPFKICLLDELDGMTKDSQRALKRTMERAQNVRFIITCNNEHNVEYPIRSRCANYLFKSLTVDTMVDVLLYIGLNENYKVGEKDLKDFAETLNGDMRRAINELQACAFSNSNLKEKTKEFMNNYIEIIKALQANLKGEANNLLLKEVYLGRNVQEIANNLHHCVLEMDMNREDMFKNLSNIGEMEWRSKSMTPKILVSWFVAQY